VKAIKRRIMVKAYAPPRQRFPEHLNIWK